MSWKMFVQEALLAAAILGGWTAAGGLTLKGGLEKENRLAAKRLEKMASPFLQKACRAKDDLAMQEIVQALAQVPGVSFACVLDPEGKVLAHSRLALIGKTVGSPPAKAAIVHYPLRDGKTRWGSLTFALSDKSARSLSARQTHMGIWGTLLAGALFVWRLWFRENRIRALRRELADRSALLAEEKAQGARLEKRLQEAGHIWSARLAGALEKIPRPVLLLDHRQRVVSANRLASRALDLADPCALPGLSWQEIPALARLGGTLEQSVLSPGREVDSPPDLSAVRWRFSTIASCADDVPATWITAGKPSLPQTGDRP